VKIHFFSRKDRQHNGKKKKDKPISTKPYNENQNVINMNPTKTHEGKVVPDRGFAANKEATQPMVPID
jgi:hypothetical protein